MVLAEARSAAQQRRDNERSGARPRSIRRRAAVRRLGADVVDGALVTKTTYPRKANLGRFMIAAAVVTGLLLGSLGLRAKVVKCGYTLSRLEEALASAQTEYDRLSLAVANLQSLERVEEAARARLGMVDPTSTEFVVLASGEPDRTAPAGAENEPALAPSRLGRSFATRAGDALIGLVSPFVARWFYDVPIQDHPRVRVAAR